MEATFVRRHRAILWPLGVGALLRVTWVLYAARSEPAFESSGDQYSYWALSESIGAGHGYTIPEWVERGLDPTSYYPVGWPAILGGVAAIRNNTPLPDDAVASTAILQIGFGLLSILFVYLICRRTCTDRIATVAAWIVALFPNLVIAVATYSVELPFIALTLAALTIAVTHDWSSGPPSTRRLVALGAVLAAGVMVRPFAAPLVVGLLIAAVVAGYSWRSVVKVVGVPVALITLALIPWTIRNYETHDAFVPLSTNLGDTLCMDRVSDANGTFRWATHEGCADPSLPEAERSRENTKKAIRFVVENPAKEVQLWGMRLYRMMEDDRVALGEVEGLAEGAFLPDWLRRGLGILADTYFFAVGALAVVGAAMVRRGMWRGPERIIVFTTAVFLLVIPMLLWGATRFHVPLEPFMAMMAAVPLGALWGRRSPEPEDVPVPAAQSTS